MRFANYQENFPELIEQNGHGCSQKFFYREPFPAGKQDLCRIETLVKSGNACRLFIPSAIYFYPNCFVSLLQNEINFVVALPPKFNEGFMIRLRLVRENGFSNPADFFLILLLLKDRTILFTGGC